MVGIIFTVYASILFGIIMIAAGFYGRKHDKPYEEYVFLIGTASIIMGLFFIALTMMNS